MMQHRRGFRTVVRESYAGISGRTSIRRISAAIPKSVPGPCSTRKTRAWQQTQHFSPEVNSGGRIRTNSTSEPSAMREFVYRNMPFALTSRVWALASGFAVAPRTRTGKVATTLSRDRRSILDFINPTCHPANPTCHPELEMRNHKRTHKRPALSLNVRQYRPNPQVAFRRCVRSGLHFRTAQARGRYY